MAVQASATAANTFSNPQIWRVWPQPSARSNPFQQPARMQRNTPSDVCTHFRRCILSISLSPSVYLFLSLSLSLPLSIYLYLSLCLYPYISLGSSKHSLSLSLLSLSPSVISISISVSLSAAKMCIYFTVGVPCWVPLRWLFHSHTKRTRHTHKTNTAPQVSEASGHASELQH